MSIVGAVVVVVTSIAVHELGHAVAARLVGHQLFEVQIGSGPSLTRRYGHLVVRIGILPLGGHIQAATDRRDGFRWRSAAVAGAGAAANIVLAGVGLAAGLASVVGFNLFAAAANLWPGRRPRMGGAKSDGRVLWELLVGRPDRMADERSGWFVLQALSLHQRGRLDEARAIASRGMSEVGPTRPLLALHGLLSFASRDFRAAALSYAPLIDDPEVDRRGRAGYATDAAWSALLSGDDDLVTRALPWARTACSMGHRSERRDLILALAEIEAGEVAGGLARARAHHSSTAAAVEVWGLARLGDGVGAASRWAGLAGSLAADHPLRPRIDAVLAESPPS